MITGAAFPFRNEPFSLNEGYGYAPLLLLRPSLYIFIGIPQFFFFFFERKIFNQSQ